MDQRKLDKQFGRNSKLRFNALPGKYMTPPQYKSQLKGGNFVVDKNVDRNFKVQHSFILPNQGEYYEEP